MAAKKRKKEEESMDIITADADSPQIIATNVTVPKKSTPKKRVRTPRNDLSVKPQVTLNFKAWFTNLLDRDRRFKEHHYEQIKLYMKGLGLGENEEYSKYEDAVNRYFGG